LKNESKPRKDNSVIKIGIDLGTTNSEVAINSDGAISIIKNADGSEYTPSVFGVDKAMNKIVGIKAYDRLYKTSTDDEMKNYKAEVKRLMGTAEKVFFERQNVELSPEEMSAEILKSLKGDVARNYPELPVIAAVITVPAHFSALQAEATKRAGLLAGFKHVVLLQEPIAAAMAYGFDNSDDQNWLVYDLGGGTFDVALISSKDGILTVIGHGGDNFMGGKDLDLKIVEEVIKPAILEKYNFKNFDRNNKKYKSTFAKLKAIAEAAKINLTQYKSVPIDVENIGTDEDGKDIYISTTLDRSKFEKLIAPAIAKTVELTKKTLEDSGVKTSSIAKIVMVGGPTQIPFVRQTIEKEFKIKIDTSIDPLTVVAKGACIFGLSQRVPDDILLDNHETEVHEEHVNLDYESMTSDDDQTIIGVLGSLKDSDSDYYIQIQSDSGFYTSSKIKLRNGKFFDTIAIEKGKTNAYWLYLFDDKGGVIPIFPDSFSITHGMTTNGSPIPHEIGVIYAKKDINNNFSGTEICDAFFEKSSIPPLKKTETYYTVKKLEKGKDTKLPIKVYEDQHGSANPETVHTLTTLNVEGLMLPYDLPEKTAIDITISIDESRTTTVEAYIPSIDRTLNVRADEYAQSIDSDELKKDLNIQKERLHKAKSQIPSSEYEKLTNDIDNITENVKNADLDVDDKSKAERDLRELKTNLNGLEERKELPKLKEEVLEGLGDASSIIEALDPNDEKTELLDQLDVLKSEVKKAIDAEDKTMLIRLNEQIRQIAFSALRENPAVWIMWLENIKSRKSELTNQSDGEFYVNKADKAVENGDVEELKRCVRNLIELLPEDVQDQINESVAGITK
jgi:molecular chaperone DnaK